MKTLIQRLRINIIALIPLLLLVGCATNIKPTATSNPPPAEPFSAFTKFEVNDISLAPPYHDNSANQKALIKIQESFSATVTPLLSSWNHAGALQDKAARTLVISPVVTEIKFIGGGARFWAGAMAGSSAGIMHVTFTEKETGKVIAKPQFYARGDAWAGGFTIGATDNAMLVNLANRSSDYIMKNYPQAVGGPIIEEAK